MNEATLGRMRAATEAQAAEIRQQPCCEPVSREFGLEYAIAKELHQARKEANLTQSQLAAIMGTTQSVVSRIESGANVSVETLARYAAACGKNLDVRVVP